MAKIILLMLAFVMILANCTTLDRKSATAYFEEGASLVQKGKVDEGIEQYKKGLRREPRSSVGYNYLAIAYRRKYEQLRSLDWREKEIEAFKKSIEIDKKEEEVRTTNIAELGIGCNPAIDKAIGYILTDEKLGGSVHVAFGSNFSYGGTSKSSMHWDFVTHPSATIEIVDTGKVIMKDGKIL